MCVNNVFNHPLPKEGGVGHIVANAGPTKVSPILLSWGKGESSKFPGVVSKRLKLIFFHIRTPLALTSPFSPMLSKTRHSGQYHLVVRAGTSDKPTHSRWNHSCLQFCKNFSPVLVLRKIERDIHARAGKGVASQ